MRYLFSSGTVWVCIAFTIGLCTTGCTSFREELLRSGDSAPAWTQGKVQTALPDSSADVFFVGRSVGYNVLDEAAAVSAAREDVFRQVAQMITTRVTTQGESSDSRWDSESDFEFKDMRYLPGGELQQQIHREAMQFTAGLAGELIDRDVDRKEARAIRSAFQRDLTGVRYAVKGNH